MCMSLHGRLYNDIKLVVREISRKDASRMELSVNHFWHRA
jgi:hypothetical protein